MIEHLRTSLSAGKEKTGKISLIPLSYPDGTAGAESRFPFLTVSKKDPISRLVEAEIVSDAGSLIKRVFLLIQKDEYSVESDDLWPVVNEDLDKCWQRAYKIYCGPETKEADPVIFREQLKEQKFLVPYHPLFYCRRVRRFFHPPCPQCGKPLELCLDDYLLKKNNLQAYSSSLARYLYCEKCAEDSKTPRFYVKIRRSGEPSGLKDFKDLVSSYGELLNADAGSELPCEECRYIGDCFYDDSLSENRIVPFSFFPFHMLVFEASSLNACDFIPLLSGASEEEVAQKLNSQGEFGRKNRLESLSFGDKKYLFENDPRLFIEILYLKLSFLGEFAKKLFKNIRLFRYPDLRISLDGIWVKLEQKNSMLPAFWNFTVVPINIGGNAPESRFTPKLPPFFSLYGLSVIWFHTLVVNKKNSPSKVLERISDETGRLAASEGHTFDRFLKEIGERQFGPENIFYDPEKTGGLMPYSESGQGKLPAHLQTVWEKTLALGWSLLKSSMSGDRNWSEEKFCSRLETLRDEVRTLMLSDIRSHVPSEAAAFQSRETSRCLENFTGKGQGRALSETLEKEDSFKLELEEYADDFELEEIDGEEAETAILSMNVSPADGLDIGMEMDSEEEAESDADTVYTVPPGVESDGEPDEPSNRDEPARSAANRSEEGRRGDRVE